MAPLPRSPLAGFLIAIPAALGAWIVFLYAWTHLTEGPVNAAGLTIYALIGGVVFGLPILAATVVLVALPLSVLLRLTIGLSLTAAIMGGALCGVLVRVLVESAWGQPEVRFVPWPVVISTGALTGWIWWRVSNRSHPSERSMSAL